MLRAELKVVGGKQHGSLIGLETRKFLVGREQDCQMRPSSESVSRHHCVFTLDEFSVRLRDLGSTNGTFVNGQRVHGQVVLHSGDRVLIGKLEFEMVIQNAVAVQYARVAPSTGSDAGFKLTDLAEMPESAPGGDTATNLAPTKTLAEAPAESLDTQVMKADNTAIVPPLLPASTGTVSETDPTQVEIPALPLQNTSTSLEIPGDQAVSAVPAAASAAAIPPLVRQQGMPMAPGAMMSPYGMPAPMPGGYPQPTYIQAPFASYTPPYMPSPYGMQQPFMPQPYTDPAYQQMAYQQHLAQQQYAQQQALMAQYAPAPQAGASAISEDVPDTTSAAAPLPIRLPLPEETGAKPPAPVPTAEGTEAPPPAAPQIPTQQLAAKIIKKFMNRR
jgi:predicted component of type VI protein secretion system